MLYSNRRVFIFILVFSVLMGWSFISHIKSRQILSGVEASSGGDIQSMGFPPAPILSCFDAAVDIPDLQEEARVRGDNTNQGGRRVKEILDKLNRPWAEIQGSLDKSLSHRLDEAIKEKALQIKISALADIALYGLQKWKKNEISLENNSFCTQAWQSKFSNYFEANKNAVNYALKSLNNGAITILNKARIFHVLKILIKNRSDLETLAKMKRESSQKKAQDFGQSVAEAVALGQSAQNPKVAELAFDIELLQKKRRQDIESLGEEYLKLEKRLAEENIVFEAPELFKPKGYIDLTPGVVDWDRSIGIMEPSRLFKDLEGMLQSHGLFQAILSVPQDERDSRINEFIDKNYKDLRRAFYFSYSELFNQGLREYEDLCRRDPKEFYANKLLVGMAATHLMTSDAKVSRDDIIKSYRPVCENLARQERLQKTTEGALESLSVAGSALGVVSLAFPLAAGTLKILPNLAASLARYGVYRAALMGAGSKAMSAAMISIVGHGAGVLLVNQYDLEIKNLFLLREMAKNASASDLDAIKAQTAGKLLQLRDQLEQRLSVQKDAIMLAAFPLLFHSATRVLVHSSDRAVTEKLSKVIDDFQAGRLNADQTLRGLFASQRRIDVTQINESEFQAWRGSMERSIKNQSVAGANTGKANSVVPFINRNGNEELLRHIKNLDKNPNTMALATSKRRYLATVTAGGRQPTSGDVNLILSWTDETAISIMTELRKEARQLVAQGQTEAEAIREASKKFLGEESNFICGGGCGLCPVPGTK